MVMPITTDPPSENTPIATVVSMPEEPSSVAERRQHATSSAHLRKYRGGFTSSICAIFRDPDRRTDCCAVACCGVLSSDRSRYLLTGERPPPLWNRVLMYLVIPALFIVAMNYFAVDVTVDDGSGSGEGQTVRTAPREFVWSFIAYIITIFVYGCVKNQRTRKEIMMKLYLEGSRERGEEVDPQQLESLVSRHNLDTLRAHCCCSCDYMRDDVLYDETSMIHRDGLEEDEELEKDFCTSLWDCLSNTFWGCCGCWCQCCGFCALAQEEREVNRLTGNEQQKIDYLTFQPYSEYYPSIQNLIEHQDKGTWKHLSSISDLSSKLLKNVAAVLVVLLLFALSDINSNFTLENMIVLLLTLGQAFFIEYLVHWRWNLFDLSFDSVVKYFACGFFLTTPSAVVFELVISTLATIIAFILAVLAVSSDSELANEFTSDLKQAMKEFTVNYPAIFIFYEFVNAFVVAALIEEMVKYFGYRMVVTPDLLPGRIAPLSRNGNEGEVEPADESPPKSAKSIGAGITVAVSLWNYLHGEAVFSLLSESFLYSLNAIHAIHRWCPWPWDLHAARTSCMVSLWGEDMFSLLFVSFINSLTRI